MHRQIADKVAGAIFAGQIEKRRLAVRAARRDDAQQIVQIAACSMQLLVAPCGIGATHADGIDRQLDQRVAHLMRGDGRRRIGAGEDDRAPVRANIGSNHFDPHQRRNQHFMARARATRLPSVGFHRADGSERGAYMGYINQKNWDRQRASVRGRLLRRSR